MVMVVPLRPSPSTFCAMEVTEMGVTAARSAPIERT
jgi:hypothetical protein